jgi:hypothetical protein
VQHRHKQPLERNSVDTAIIECGVQARPLALKASGERQFNKRARVDVTSQGISEVEQCIGRTGEAAVIQVVAEGVQNAIIQVGTSFGISTKKIPDWAIWCKPDCPFLRPPQRSIQLRLL